MKHHTLAASGARTTATDAEGGRGLAIVDALSADWGWHPVPGGKCVWAILRKDG